MNRCKHAHGMKEPWDNEIGQYVKFFDDGEVRLCTVERCWRCKEWLSLGPSNDAIPAAEMRLAELLAEIHLLWEPRGQAEAIAIAVDDCAEVSRG